MKEYQLSLFGEVWHQEIKPKKSKKVLKNTEQVDFKKIDHYMPEELSVIEKIEMEEMENE